MTSILTRQDCEFIFKNFADGAEHLYLRDFSIKPATNCIGYLGEYYHLFLSYGEKNAAPNTCQTLQLFVKSEPRTSSEPEKSAIFRKEAQLYKTLLKELQKYSLIKWYPICHFTRDNVLVLEHLELKNFTVISAVNQEMDEVHMRQLLRSLAALHAASFIYEQRNHLIIGEHYGQMLEEITVSPNITWYRTGLNALVDILKIQPKYQTSYYQKFIKEQLPAAFDSVYEQIEASKEYRNVFCHRDAWAGNILFDNVTKLAILVDYQTARYCPPSVDVVFAIYLNLSKTSRQSKENHYLDCYYQFLNMDLQYFGLDIQDILPKSNFLASYEKTRLFAALYRAIATTIIKVPQCMITNDYKYINRSKALLEYMNVSTDFHACMLECIDDVMETALTVINKN